MKSIGVLGAVLMVGLFACASHEARPLLPQPIEAYQSRETIGKVTIAAEPLATKQKAEAAFYLDLTEQGYAPILLVADNHSEDNVLIVRDDIELADSSGNIHRPVPATAVAEKFERNKMAYALLGFGIFSYMSAEEANKKMVSDWASKELPAEKLLLPYRKSHGVVYFELGVGLATLPNSRLKIPLKNLRTGENQSVLLRIAAP
jgi:hypothetical protein